VTGTWVESLPPTFDPATRISPELPWIPAEGASYVAGFERPGIMGAPLLSFARRDDADSAGARVGGYVLDWSAVRSTPAHLAPPAP
jgi:nitrous oxide reductase accessory protein NosL